MIQLIENVEPTATVEEFSIPEHVQEIAYLRLRIRSLESQLALAQSAPARDLLATRNDIGRDAVAVVLEWDPEATEGFADLDGVETHDMIPCSSWRVSDAKNRDWTVELRVEPARTGRVGKEYPAKLAYWCEMVDYQHHSKVEAQICASTTSRPPFSQRIVP